MAKDIELAGSNDREDDRFEKAESTSSQTNYYVGDKETGSHCHMWTEHDGGKSGVTHRGECKVCDGGENSSSGK